MQAKKIWIVGASHGIGKALAFELGQRGHQLAISARSQEALQHIHQKLPQGNHLVIDLDVSQAMQIQKALQQIQAEWQTLDSVIFMAAFYEPSSLLKLTQDNIEQTVAVNFTGALYLIQSVLSVFCQQQHGQIAICASVAGYRGLANAQPYAATKAALINLTESLNSEYGEWLDIKLINPGFVETRLTAKNDFVMPAQLSTDQAAVIIANQLNQKKFEIHFPKRLTFALKFLKVLPDFLYFKISQKLK